MTGSRNTLTTRIPQPLERARFSSIESAVQHLASALGAFASAQFLVELPDKTLSGVTHMAYASMGLGFAVVPLLWVVESRVQRARAVVVPGSP